MQNNSFSNVIIWRSIQGVGQQSFQFVISIILARLLFPEDFGKIGVLTIFFVIANTLIESGLGVALVREKDVNSIDINTVFTFNLLISILLYLTLFFLAPAIANFYNDIELTILMRVVGVKILISALSIVNYSLLRRNLKMKAIALVSMYSIIIGGLVAIIMAILDYRVWAIVFQQLVMSLILLLGYSFYTKRVDYKIQFSLRSIKKLFSFGGYLLIATLISRISDNIYALLIGRNYSMVDVGYFNRAQTLHKLPIMLVNKSIAEGAIPKIYQMQDDVEKLLNSSREIFRLINFITFPLIVGMLLFNGEIVILLLTEKWIAITPFFKIFLIASLFYSHNYFSQMIFKAIGKTNIFFRIELISKIALTIAVIIAIQFSIITLAMCIVLVNITLLLLNMFYLNKQVGYNYKNLFHDVRLPIITSILMLLLLLIINKIINVDILLFDLISKVLLGFVFYFIINIIFKNETAKMLKSKLQKRLTK